MRNGSVDKCGVRSACLQFKVARGHGAVSTIAQAIGYSRGQVSRFINDTATDGVSDDFLEKTAAFLESEGFPVPSSDVADYVFLEVQTLAACVANAAIDREFKLARVRTAMQQINELLGDAPK